MAYNQLTAQQVAQLVRQGCTAANWQQVMVSASCDVKRIINVRFSGTVRVGDTGGTHTVDGVGVPCGIYGALVDNCDVGDHVRISNVGSVISNYAIENEVLIEDVGALAADAKATFGNRVKVEAINEAGGRGVRLVNDLTSQTAYIQGMLRHNAGFTKKLEGLVEAVAKKVQADKGRVSSGARVLHCGTLHNVNIGPSAFVHGAQFLENGSINSCVEHPSEVGEAVQARSFILSEGASVESGAILDKVFVGQGAKIGRQFTAENSLFFANCEAFQGEAVSLFAGPYTVTHHKSTLLIAGTYSFLNAGSGTNQSNHMYKLGPVHQGVFERGCKTGSFSYLLFESHIGAFSVVIGKHHSNLDLPNLPFSYILEDERSSRVVPAKNLATVGTVRDGEKWLKRDGRKAPKKRDLIIFDVFSPYTVEKMRRGRDELLALSEKAPKDKISVTYGGAQVNCLSLTKGVKYYWLAIDRYLNEKVLERLRKALTEQKNWKSAVASLKPSSALKKVHEWTDISGLLTPHERLSSLEQRVASGAISSYDALLEEFQGMYDAYRSYEWQYIYETYAAEYGVQLETLTKEQLLSAVERWENAAMSLLGMILEDSRKEFGASARIGYGIDEPDENIQKDFEAVRGTIEANSVVQKLAAEEESIRQRKEELRALVSSSEVNEYAS